MLFRIPRAQDAETAGYFLLGDKILNAIENRGFAGCVPKFIRFFQACIKREEGSSSSPDAWRVTVFGFDYPFDLPDIEIVMTDAEIGSCVKVTPADRSLQLRKPEYSNQVQKWHMEFKKHVLGASG